MKLFFFTVVGGPYRWEPLYTAHPAHATLRACSIFPSRWPKSLAKAKRNTCIYSTKRELAKLLCLDSNNHVANFSWIGQLSKWVPVLG